jgi:hypothetical protein
MRIRRLLSVVIVIAALYCVLPTAAHAMQVEGEIASIDLDRETLVVVRDGNEFTFKCEKFLLEGYKVGDRVNVIYREKLNVNGGLAPGFSGDSAPGVNGGSTSGVKVVVRIKKRVKKVNLGC